MKLAIFIITSCILLPYFVFLLSKLQMLGWIAGIKSHLIEEEKEKQNGEKTESK